MAHDENCECGCEHEHLHTRKISYPTSSELTESQKDFLHQLSHHRFLPVGRFILKDSREDGFVSCALAPVFIHSKNDDMKTVKEAGAFLQKLEDMGLITLDYDIFLDGYSYEEYKDSSLYKYFCETVKEGAAKAGFLGNTPELELGSIASTEMGSQIAAEYCGHNHESHD